MDIPYQSRRYRTGKDALTEKEVNLIFQKVEKLEEESLISLAIASGIRREDIVAIEKKNIEIDETYIPEGQGHLLKIIFWEQKRKRYWTTYVGGRAAQSIIQLMNVQKKNKIRARWLFISPHDKNKHLSGRTAYNILQKLLKRAGLRPRPFHALRATCMKMCQKKGWSIEQTMELTGDSWRTVQEHYLTPTEDEMKETATKKRLVSFSSDKSHVVDKPLL
jgi:integrase